MVGESSQYVEFFINLDSVTEHRYIHIGQFDDLDCSNTHIIPRVILLIFWTEFDHPRDPVVVEPTTSPFSQFVSERRFLLSGKYSVYVQNENNTKFNNYMLKHSFVLHVDTYIHMQIHMHKCSKSTV